MKVGKRKGKITPLYCNVRAYFHLLVISIFIALALTSVSAQRPASMPRATKKDMRPVRDLHAITDIVDPATTLDFRKKDTLLSKILVPRVPDSSGNANVREALLAPFRRNKMWEIEEHQFMATTPQGEKKMTNLIMTYNPTAPRKLVLAAHHDSKVSPRGFVGATDSAVPCAVMVDTAIALEKLIDAQKKEEKESAYESIALQFIFFDGEEAYLQWSQEDSVYGSRALATKWSRSFTTPQLAKRRKTPGFTTMRTIDSIDQFVLLDLLGTPNPRIPSYFSSTQWMHEQLRDIEKQLAKAGRLYPRTAGKYDLPPPGGRTTDTLPLPDTGSGVTAQARTRSFFPDDASLSHGIDDDHRPFLVHGVPILHLIPSPFPPVWHTMRDDASSLDWPTIHAWAMLMRVFVAEYMGIDSTSGYQSRSHAQNTSLYTSGHVLDELVSTLNAHPDPMSNQTMLPVQQ